MSEIPKIIQNCIDKNVLENFNNLQYNLNKERFPLGPFIIKDTECLGNGREIAKKTAEKINLEYPELKSVYKRKDKLYWAGEFLFGALLDGEEYKEWRVNTKARKNFWE